MWGQGRLPDTPPSVQKLESANVFMNGDFYGECSVIKYPIRYVSCLSFLLLTPVT